MSDTDKYDWRAVIARVRSAAENRNRLAAPAYLPWDGSCRTQRLDGHFISGDDLAQLEAALTAANARADEAEAALVAACEIIASVATCTTTNGHPLTAQQWAMRFLPVGRAESKGAMRRPHYRGGER